MSDAMPNPRAMVHKVLAHEAAKEPVENDAVAQNMAEELAGKIRKLIYRAAEKVGTDDGFIIEQEFFPMIFAALLASLDDNDRVSWDCPSTRLATALACAQACIAAAQACDQ
jgi:hypothetical protein